MRIQNEPPGQPGAKPRCCPSSLFPDGLLRPCAAAALPFPSSSSCLQCGVCTIHEVPCIPSFHGWMHGHVHTQLFNQFIDSIQGIQSHELFMKPSSPSLRAAFIVFPTGRQAGRQTDKRLVLDRTDARSSALMDHKDMTHADTHFTLEHGSKISTSNHCTQSSAGNEPLAKIHTHVYPSD